MGPVTATTTASPAWRSWGMVADAEELVADEPDVPVLELVTRVATRGNSSLRARVAGLGRLVRLRGNTDPIGLIAGQDGS